MVKIDGTEFGEIKVDGKTYYSDMIVWFDGKLEFKTASHIFEISEFLKLAQRKPEVMVIGTGQSGIVKVPDEVLQAAEDRGVKLFVETSKKAADIFNAFVSDGKKVVAIIHVTC